MCRQCAGVAVRNTCRIRQRSFSQTLSCLPASHPNAIIDENVSHQSRCFPFSIPCSTAQIAPALCFHRILRPLANERGGTCPRICSVIAERFIYVQAVEQLTQSLRRSPSPLLLMMNRFSRPRSIDSRDWETHSLTGTSLRILKCTRIDACPIGHPNSRPLPCPLNE